MLDDKILNYFKKHEEGYVSGEELSRELGISRAAELRDKVKELKNNVRREDT